jgi:hypothetical protein
LLLCWRTNFHSAFNSFSAFVQADDFQFGFLSYLQLQQNNLASVQADEHKIPAQQQAKNVGCHAFQKFVT